LQSKGKAVPDMCGITLCVAPADVYDTDATWHGHEEPNMASSSRPSFSEVLHSLHSENARRGPDASGVYGTQVHTPAGTLRVSLGAAVLGLRGTLTPQPLVGERGVLAWNGQVFAGLDVAPGENDTRALFTRLEAGDDPAELFARVEGP
jgi:asparagine synthetase B (glutamine-hydrolysing)